jgi:hypothetical protein
LGLLRFPVRGVFIAEPAKLLGFHTVGVGLLFFGGVVIALFAIGAG